MTSFPPPSSGPEYGAPGSHGSPAGAAQYGRPAGEAAHGQPGSAGSAPVPARPAPGTDLGADLGAALTFTGRVLLRNPAAYLLSALIFSVLIFLIILAAVLAGGFTIAAMAESAGYTDEPSFADLALVYAIILGISALAAPLSVLWQSGAARAGVMVLDGGRPSVGQALAGPLRVILTTLLTGAIIAVGTLLLYVPGLIAAVLLFYAVPASARGASPIAALAQSARLAKAKLGTTIVAYLVMMVLSSVAGLLPILLLALIPFYVLFQLGMYERVSGRALPEPARA
ncbi:hypothetical protein [Brachybacterium sp. UNK5269]|uniref:hypothetical protein n=1 Tax=Brachybacterium sp. UNK5269 TaxID=3408576 RepID=UPI003BB20FD7